MKAGRVEETVEGGDFELRDQGRNNVAAGLRIAESVMFVGVVDAEVGGHVGQTVMGISDELLADDITIEVFKRKLRLAVFR